MSSVMRPTGPLPARVYWVRRALLVVVLVVVVALLWWAVQKVTGSAQESGAVPDPSVSDANADGVDPAPVDPDTEQTTTRVESDSERRRDDKPRRQKPNRLAPRPSTGPCDVTDVDIDIDVSDVEQGRPNRIVFVFTGPPRTACDLAITPDTLAMRITSGDDVVWSSDDCPDRLLARQVVVRDRPTARYAFTWDGRRSTGSCAGEGKDALAGGYWVEAALIGADLNEAYFDVLAS